MSTQTIQMQLPVLQKVKLAKVKNGEGLELVFKQTDPDGTQATGTGNHKGLVHPDLKEAMTALRPHLAMLCGFVKTGAVEDIAAPEDEMFENFFVKGISLGGDEDHPGVVISGYFINDRGKAITLNTPFEMFDGAPESRYHFMDDVVAKIAVIEQEVPKYLSGEKRGTPKQGTLDIPDAEPVTKIQIAEPAKEIFKETKEGGKVKKMRVKKVKQTADAPSGEVVEEGD